jgi:N-acetylglucosamine-6-phosphate deacetylase
MKLRNATIVTPNKILSNGWLEIQDGIIQAIGTGTVEGLDLNGAIVLPGFIDQHIHGGFGVDFMHATGAELDHFGQSVVAHGVTSYLATTLTDEVNVIVKALQTLRQYQSTQSEAQAQMVGIHLEGPFVHPEFPGAQSQSHIIPPDKVQLKEFQTVANQTIRLLTYAPEWGHSLFTSYAVQLGMVPSIGHSSATLEEVDAAIAEGAKQITHFHNASSPYHHRHPGVVNAGLYRDIAVELIADGYHVDPLVVGGVTRLKGASNVHLITDAISAMGQPDGTYQLGPYQVTKAHQTVRLQDGTLAGSVVTFPQILQNIQAWTSCSLQDIARMTSTNQAALLGLTDRGSIEAGKRADLVVVNADFEILQTYVKGVRVYSR